MDNFVIAQPESTDHVCQNDQFLVSGGPPSPSICGVNTGQHSKYYTAWDIADGNTQ